MKSLSHLKLVIGYYLTVFRDTMMLRSMPVPDFNNKYDETML
jgi:hypothetical protein